MSTAKCEPWAQSQETPGRSCWMAMSHDKHKWALSLADQEQLFSRLRQLLHLDHVVCWAVRGSLGPLSAEVVLREGINLSHAQVLGPQAYSSKQGGLLACHGAPLLCLKDGAGPASAMADVADEVGGDLACS